MNVEKQKNRRSLLPLSDMGPIMTRIMLAGGLAMVWMHLCRGAQRAAFIRELGATKFQFGLIGAIPQVMLVVQVMAGLVVGRLRHRKPLWLVMLLSQRAGSVLIGLIPWIIPEGHTQLRIWSLMALLALIQGLGSFSLPIFFSWMGDLLPHGQLSEFWGQRRRWLCLSQAATMIAATLFFWVLNDVHIYYTYLAAALVGSVAGVWDICLFFRIPEPEHHQDDQPGLSRLLAPYRSKSFGRLMIYFAALQFATMMSAPFMQVFMLEELGLRVHGVVFFFIFHALGGMLLARRLGGFVDLLGHRPVIRACGALKCLIALTFCLLRPGWGLAVLLLVLPFDNMLNTGLFTARDGFVMKLAPKEGRAMFSAAVLATGGAASALGSLTGGLLLKWLPAELFSIGNWHFTDFRALFAISALLRLSSFFVSRFLHEPGSAGTRDLLDAIRPRRRARR